MSDVFQVGQLVKWLTPITPEELNERYTVLEVNGDRLLVQFVCNWRINPTSTYLASDLTPAE